MSWITIVWSMTAAACLTLAGVHLLVWLRARNALGHLLFTSSALGAAAVAGFELALMQADSIERFHAVVRWGHVPVWVLVISLVGFIRLYLRAGRPWLAWTVVGMRSLALLLNFLSEHNLNYTAITSLQQIPVLGEPATVAVGTLNPWTRVGELSSLLLLALMVEATITVWRRGDRRPAGVVGGGMIFFVTLGAGHSALIHAGVIQLPYFISFAFLGIVLAMAYELSRDVLRAAQLASDLKESESHLLQNRAELKDLLHFERLTTDISSRLMSVPAEELGKQIVPAMGQVAQFLGFDAATLALFTGKDAAARLSYVWNAPDISGLPANLTDKDFPWSARELLAGRDVYIRTLDDFPPEAQAERATYERYGIKSALDVPVIVSGQPVGVLSMGSFRQEQSISPQFIERQRTLGNIFGNALVRARSEIALRESEERMLLAAEAAQLGMWMWDIPRNTIWLTEKLREGLGYSATEEVSYDRFLERVHEADRANTREVVQRALVECGSFHSEYRVMRPDGSLRWMAGTGRVKIDATGAPVLLLGVAMDITELRRIEVEAREVSSKLITAQEDERKRIARDLHDDLNQRLALLSVQMEIFGADSKDPSGLSRERLESMTSQVKELSSEVHRLSYQLHPAKLDQLGLVVAARTFCREVAAQSGIPVHFEQHDVPRDVNADAALCLYRLIQEALQNSVRHNGGAAIQVRLTCSAEQIRLLVSDQGKGFDVDYAMHNGGLGLVSMRERVRQVKGSIQVTSAPGKGARIEVSVPLLPPAAA